MREFTEQEILEAIQDTGGIINKIAQKLNCDWHTADKYISKYESSKIALQDERQTLIDDSENVIRNAVRSGDVQSAKFVLTTLGKKRGYTEKTEVEHSGDMSITINRHPVKSDTKLTDD